MIAYPLNPFFDFPASEVFDVEVDFPGASTPELVPPTFSPDSANKKINLYWIYVISSITVIET